MRLSCKQENSAQSREEAPRPLSTVVERNLGTIEVTGSTPVVGSEIESWESEGGYIPSGDETGQT